MALRTYAGSPLITLPGSGARPNLEARNISFLLPVRLNLAQETGGIQ